MLNIFAKVWVDSMKVFSEVAWILIDKGYVRFQFSFHGNGIIRYRDFACLITGTNAILSYRDRKKTQILLPFNIWLLK